MNIVRASPRAWRKAKVRWLGAVAIALAAAGCGSSARPAQSQSPPPALLAEARPIGSGAAFQPRVTGPVLGRCTHRLGARAGAHVEVFAANRVVLVPAGIGTKPPRARLSGRISSARCYGELVTIDPTGLVLVRRGAQPVLADLFRSWGQPLSSKRVASFTASRPGRVVVFVNGRSWSGPPTSVPLRPHAEIVLEVGPYVPPHASYMFPPGT
jgi:hypothetical protein